MTWIWIVMVVAIVGNGIRLRARARDFDRIPRPATPGNDSTPADAECLDAEYALLMAAGAELAEDRRRAALAFASQRGLDVLDLIPEDLPVERALYLLRLVDPASYSSDCLAAGRGAGHAIVVKRALLDRAQLGASETLTARKLAEITTTLKAYAPRSANLAVLPGMTALSPAAPAAHGFWCAVYGESIGLVLGFHAAEYALFALGLWLAPWWALAGLVAYSVQPWVIFSGTGLHPRDLRWQGLTRLVQAPISTWRTFAARRALAREDAADAEDRAERQEQSRREYAQRIAGGLEAFFEPRRSDCPLCGSSQLGLRLLTRDFFHHKPGSFRLDECRDCGHVFQNPRLSFEGLDFYYKDFYDGAWDGPMEVAFQSGGDGYRARAEALCGHAEPRRWLDVGTGHAHFCLWARDVWPETTFDGLDMGVGVEEAKRRGWVSEGYRHAFPEVAHKLAGSYDVVSMHHYLEHTLDPLAELDAAAEVLRPGGHLLIEVPDPEFPFARVFGRRWISWFQPQHLHFVPLGNLKQALRERGFEPVAEQTSAAHIPADMSFALYSLLESLAPPLGMPWQPEHTTGRYVWRIAVLSTLGPFLALTLVLDKLFGVALSRTSLHGNTYRLLAKRTDAPAPERAKEQLH